MHPTIDAAWFEITAFILSLVLGIGLVLILEFKPKTSRLDNKTDDFIQLKHWDSRKDGIK
jgi:hypothetical protein